MIEIKDWPVFNAIKYWNTNYIKFVYVYGISGKEVIFVTNDDNVYAFGENSSGVLGLGHKNAVKEPTLVEKLCQKDITLIQSNRDYVMALTKSGQIYSWGESQYGCLGNKQNKCYEPNLIHALNGVYAIDVCCGLKHWLALTKSGEVHAWGSHRGNTGNTYYSQSDCFKVSALTSVRVTAIACGSGHSMALTDTGVVFGWGANNYIQLGNADAIDQNSPIKVDLSEDIVITKVLCGSENTLLLSLTGDVYACGSNNWGQNEDGSTHYKPVKIAFQTKIKDILASNSYNISIALTVDNRCMVWGVNSLTVPTEVTQNNMNDAFNYLTKITIKPLPFADDSTPVLYKRFSNFFNVKEYSDIKFIIDGKHIYAQKLYLKSVCKHFDDMFSNEWRENTTNEIEITQFSYSVYHSYLKYLYTNKVDIKLENAFDLLELANCYLDDELKNECVNVIKNAVNIENVCQIYSSAFKINFDELKNYCVNYSTDKMWCICETNGYKQMSEESLKAMVCALFNSNHVKHKLMLS